MDKEKKIYMQNHLMELVGAAEVNREENESFAVALEMAWCMYYMEIITWCTYKRIRNLLMQWRYPRRRNIAEEDMFREDM